MENRMNQRGASSLQMKLITAPGKEDSAFVGRQPLSAGPSSCGSGLPHRTLSSQTTQWQHWAGYSKYECGRHIMTRQKKGNRGLYPSACSVWHLAPGISVNFILNLHSNGIQTQLTSSFFGHWRIYWIIIFQQFPFLFSVFSSEILNECVCFRYSKFRNVLHVLLIWRN